MDPVPDPEEPAGGSQSPPQEQAASRRNVPKALPVLPRRRAPTPPDTPRRPQGLPRSPRGESASKDGDAVSVDATTFVASDVPQVADPVPEDPAARGLARTSSSSSAKLVNSIHLSSLPPVLVSVPGVEGDEAEGGPQTVADESQSAAVDGSQTAAHESRSAVEAWQAVVDESQTLEANAGLMQSAVLDEPDPVSDASQAVAEEQSQAVEVDELPQAVVDDSQVVVTTEAQAVVEESQAAMGGSEAVEVNESRSAEVDESQAVEVDEPQAVVDKQPQAVADEPEQPLLSASGRIMDERVEMSQRVEDVLGGIDFAGLDEDEEVEVGDSEGVAPTLSAEIGFSFSTNRASSTSLKVGTDESIGLDAVILETSASRNRASGTVARAEQQPTTKKAGDEDVSVPPRINKTLAGAAPSVALSSFYQRLAGGTPNASAAGRIASEDEEVMTDDSFTFPSRPRMSSGEALTPLGVFLQGGAVAKISAKDTAAPKNSRKFQEIRLVTQDGKLLFFEPPTTVNRAGGEIAQLRKLKEAPDASLQNAWKLKLDGMLCTTRGAFAVCERKVRRESRVNVMMPMRQDNILQHWVIHNEDHVRAYNVFGADHREKHVLDSSGSESAAVGNAGGRKEGGKGGRTGVQETDVDVVDSAPPAARCSNRAAAEPAPAGCFSLGPVALPWMRVGLSSTGRLFLVPATGSTRLIFLPPEAAISRVEQESLLRSAGNKAGRFLRPEVPFRIRCARERAGIAESLKTLEVKHRKTVTEALEVASLQERFANAEGFRLMLTRNRYEPFFDGSQLRGVDMVDFGRRMRETALDYFRVAALFTKAYMRLKKELEVRKKLSEEAGNREGESGANAAAAATNSEEYCNSVRTVHPGQIREPVFTSPKDSWRMALLRGAGQNILNLPRPLRDEYPKCVDPFEALWLQQEIDPTQPVLTKPVVQQVQRTGSRTTGTRKSSPSGAASGTTGARGRSAGAADNLSTTTAAPGAGGAMAGTRASATAPGSRPPTVANGSSLLRPTGQTREERAAARRASAESTATGPDDGGDKDELVDFAMGLGGVAGRLSKVMDAKAAFVKAKNGTAVKKAAAGPPALLGGLGGLGGMTTVLAAKASKARTSVAAAARNSTSSNANKAAANPNLYFREVDSSSSSETPEMEGAFEEDADAATSFLFMPDALSSAAEEDNRIRSSRGGVLSGTITSSNRQRPSIEGGSLAFGLGAIHKPLASTAQGQEIQRSSSRSPTLNRSGSGVSQHQHLSGAGGGREAMGHRARLLGLLRTAFTHLRYLHAWPDWQVDKMGMQSILLNDTFLRTVQHGPNSMAAPDQCRRVHDALEEMKALIANELGKRNTPAILQIAVRVVEAAYKVLEPLHAACAKVNPEAVFVTRTDALRIPRILSRKEREQARRLVNYDRVQELPEVISVKQDIAKCENRLARCRGRLDYTLYHVEDLHLRHTKSTEAGGAALLNILKALQYLLAGLLPAEQLPLTHTVPGHPRYMECWRPGFHLMLSDLGKFRRGMYDCIADVEEILQHDREEKAATRYWQGFFTKMVKQCGKQTAQGIKEQRAENFEQARRVLSEFTLDQNLGVFTTPETVKKDDVACAWLYKYLQNMLMLRELIQQLLELRRELKQVEDAGVFYVWEAETKKELAQNAKHRDEIARMKLAEEAAAGAKTSSPGEGGANGAGGKAASGGAPGGLTATTRNVMEKKRAKLEALEQMMMQEREELLLGEGGSPASDRNEALLLALRAEKRELENILGGGNVPPSPKSKAAVGGGSNVASPKSGSKVTTSNNGAASPAADADGAAATPGSGKAFLTRTSTTGLEHVGLAVDEFPEHLNPVRMSLEEEENAWDADEVKAVVGVGAAAAAATTPGAANSGPGANATPEPMESTMPDPTFYTGVPAPLSTSSASLEGAVEFSLTATWRGRQIALGVEKFLTSDGVEVFSLVRAPDEIPIDVILDGSRLRMKQDPLQYLDVSELADSSQTAFFHQHSGLTQHWFFDPSDGTLRAYLQERGNPESVKKAKKGVRFRGTSMIRLEITDGDGSSGPSTQNRGRSMAKRDPRYSATGSLAVGAGADLWDTDVVSPGYQQASPAQEKNPRPRGVLRQQTIGDASSASPGISFLSSAPMGAKGTAVRFEFEDDEVSVGRKPRGTVAPHAHFLGSTTTSRKKQSAWLSPEQEAESEKEEAGAAKKFVGKEVQNERVVEFLRQCALSQFGSLPSGGKLESANFPNGDREFPGGLRTTEKAQLFNPCAGVHQIFRVDAPGTTAKVEHMKIQKRLAAEGIVLLPETRTFDYTKGQPNIRRLEWEKEFRYEAPPPLIRAQKTAKMRSASADSPGNRMSRGSMMFESTAGLGGMASRGSTMAASSQRGWRGTMSRSSQFFKYSGPTGGSSMRRTSSAPGSSASSILSAFSAFSQTTGFFGTSAQKKTSPFRVDNVARVLQGKFSATAADERALLQLHNGKVLVLGVRSNKVVLVPQGDTDQLTFTRTAVKSGGEGGSDAEMGGGEPGGPFSLCEAQLNMLK